MELPFGHQSCNTHLHVAMASCSIGIDLSCAPLSEYISPKQFCVRASCLLSPRTCELCNTCLQPASHIACILLVATSMHTLSVCVRYQYASVCIRSNATSTVECDHTSGIHVILFASRVDHNSSKWFNNREPWAQIAFSCWLWAQTRYLQMQVASWSCI